MFSNAVLATARCDVPYRNCRRLRNVPPHPIAKANISTHAVSQPPKLRIFHNWAIIRAVNYLSYILQIVKQGERFTLENFSFSLTFPPAFMQIVFEFL